MVAYGLQDPNSGLRSLVSQPQCLSASAASTHVAAFEHTCRLRTLCGRNKIGDGQANLQGGVMRSAAFFSVCLSFATLASCRSDNKVAGPYKPEFFVPCYSNCDPPPPPPPPPVPFSTVATAPGNPPGTLQVIALGMNDSLPYIIYQNSDGSWHWGGRLPDPNGVKFSAIATGLGNPHSDFIGHAYTLQVIATGANDSLPYVIYQNLDASWHWGG